MVEMKRKRKSGKQIILEYLSSHVGKWIHNQDLRKTAGMNDTPRTIRLLKQEGWQIEVKGDGYNRLLSLEKELGKGERSPISRKLRFQILHRDGFRCKACGRSVDDGVKLVIDHIVPVNWGGKTEEANLQVLCEECNAGKQAWVGGKPSAIMRKIFSYPTIESRIEALFDNFPNTELSSGLIQMISRGAFDWQRALRRIRQKTGKKILAIRGKNAYIYRGGN